MVVSSEPLAEIKRDQIEMLEVTGGAPFLAARGPTPVPRQNSGRLQNQQLTTILPIVDLV